MQMRPDNFDEANKFDCFRWSREFEGIFFLEWSLNFKEQHQSFLHKICAEKFCGKKTVIRFFAAWNPKHRICAF